MTQSETLDILKMGGNVFLTGPAGSGKTYVLNQYIDYLHEHHVEVAVTASTGIAATHIGGMTIHAWSGLGIKDKITDRDIDDLMEKQYLYKRFQRSKVLIIDEISMLHHYRLDMIEWICRSFKHNDKPFGGLQVIVCGDFFQLPPVTRTDWSGENTTRTLQNEFAYKSEVWQTSQFTVCYINENYRQKDSQYLEILNEIRSGKVSRLSVDLLMSRQGKEVEGSVQPTKLFSHNADVDAINHDHLDRISGEEEEFAMTSRGQANLVQTLKKSCLAPELLRLKVGARVMFVKNNYESGFVNGTLGVVTGFNSYNEPLVRTAQGRTIAVASATWKIEEEGKTKAEITQIPLRLAWAITVHKSQGMSLDAMEADLSQAFAYGMGYVALSRVRSLAGMKLLGFNHTALQVHPEVLIFDIGLQDASTIASQRLKEMKKSEIQKSQKEFLDRNSDHSKGKHKGKLDQEKDTRTSAEKTLDMLVEKKSLAHIAGERGVKQETIIAHIEDLMSDGEHVEIAHLKKEFAYNELNTIVDIFHDLETTSLTPVYNYLSKQKKKPNYTKLRLARLFL